MNVTLIFAAEAPAFQGKPTWHGQARIKADDCWRTVKNSAGNRIAYATATAARHAAQDLRDQMVIEAACRSTPFAVMVTPTNGTGEYPAARFVNLTEALEYCRYNISYTGDRVKRVEVAKLGDGRRAVWDASWDAQSQHAGLWDWSR